MNVPVAKQEQTILLTYGALAKLLMYYIDTLQVLICILGSLIVKFRTFKYWLIFSKFSLYAWQ